MVPNLGETSDENIVTDRVRSTREGYVLTHVCPSVCPHLEGGVPQPGPGGGEGYPSQVQAGGGTPTGGGGTPPSST